MATLGIDFGRFCSSVAMQRDGRGEVVADSQGHREIPSMIGFYPEMCPAVGEQAYRSYDRNFRNTVYDMKLMLGKNLASVTPLKTAWTFPISASKKGHTFGITVSSEGKEIYLTPTQCVAEVLKKLKETAENFSGATVIHAILSVPTLMTNEARNELSDAGRLAGFKQISFISEPTAAVIAYKFDEPKTDSKIVVVDFGTHLRLSLVSVQNGLIEIVDSREFSDIGSEQFDKTTRDFLQLEFKRKTSLDATESRRAVIKMQRESEYIKTVLSQGPQVSVHLEGLFEGLDLATNVSRARFEVMNSTILAKLTGALKAAGESWGTDVDKVILVGGHSKIPRVQQLIQQSFASAQLLSSINPSEVNALGAAMHGELIASRSNAINPKCSLPSLPVSIGIKAHDGKFIPVLLKGTVVPILATQQFALANEQKKVFISVYEGVAEMAADNRLLGSFLLDIQPTTEKVVIVTFLVDIKSKLSVQARIGESVSHLDFVGITEQQVIQRD